MIVTNRPGSSRLARSLAQLRMRGVQSATLMAQPVLRAALALPFFRSGQTRWDGVLSISPGTIYLFEEQFKLHLFGHQYDIPWPDAVAALTAVCEITLPVLLMLGLCTRLAATGLLGMTGVIQLVVPEGWANYHLAWSALALALSALGPGRMSLDALVTSIQRRTAPQ